MFLILQDYFFYLKAGKCIIILKTVVRLTEISRNQIQCKSNLRVIRENETLVCQEIP